MRLVKIVGNSFYQQLAFSYTLNLKSTYNSKM